MSDSSIQHALEYRVYRFLVGLLRRLPHDRVGTWGRRFGRVAMAIPRPRRLADRNLAMVFPEWGDEERRRVLRACYEHHGAFYFELASIGRLSRSEIMERFDVSGAENLEGAVAEHGACFVTTGHYGCSELALFPLADILGGVSAVARPLNNRKIDAEIRATRARFGVDIIDKAGAARRMLTAVRRGRSVAIIVDQHIRKSVGIRIPFLGHPAWTSPVLAVLSLRTGHPVVPLTCTPGDRPGHYRLALHEPILPEAEGDEAVAEMTRRYLEPVERDILERPEYWLWMHRRWRD